MLNAVRRAEGYLRGGFEILKLGSGIWNWNAYISNNNRRFMTSLPLVREDGFSHEELAPTTTPEKLAPIKLTRSAVFGANRVGS